MKGTVRTIIVMGLMFLVAQLGALVMVSSILGSQNRAFSNPNDPLIPILYIGAMILFTFVVLYIIKKKRENIVKFIFIGAVAFTIFYVLLAIAARLTPSTLGIVGLVLPIVITGVLTYYLVRKPEWYVVDASGVLMAVGVIGIFGISLNILPVMILLIALAIYDAISVYGTKHMVALADGVTGMRLPILLVIPKKRGYSYLTQGSLVKELEEGEEREAMFMGLGDIIIPGVLIASSYYNLATTGTGPFHIEGIDAKLLVSLGTLLGALLGFAALMTFVMKGRPQAGLPLLNGGAILGYLVFYALVYGNLHFGLW
jgi:presenilin-like A22 family membrane protease